MLLTLRQITDLLEVGHIVVTRWFDLTFYPLMAVITKTVRHLRVKISYFKLALLKATYLLVKICLVVIAAIATTASICL